MRYFELVKLKKGSKAFLEILNRMWSASILLNQQFPTPNLLAWKL